nr:protein kinase-like domain, concanavalin A-like lectin/glucanase domain protein [Tanacetum cinerariifolium]
MRLSHLRTQLGQHQEDMIGKINLLWKTVSKKLNDTSNLENTGNSITSNSIARISHVEKEELKKKGIKNPSKLFSLKYLSPASIKELNKNPSAPKRVHFVNSIVILNTDSDTEKEDVSSTNAHEHELGNMVRRNEEVKEQGKGWDEMETNKEVEEVFEDEESEWETEEEEEEVEEVFDDETKEEDDDTKHSNSFPTIKELVYHEWLLKNPRPSWVKAKIRAKNPSNIKISCMIGHILMKHAYIDIESPINIMSRKQYDRIMTYKLGPRKKSSNPKKISNFVGRVRGLRVFIGSLAYKCDFKILEDTTTVIDGSLGEFVFGKPFIEETSLVYNKEEGTLAFGREAHLLEDKPLRRRHMYIPESSLPEPMIGSGSQPPATGAVTGAVTGATSQRCSTTTRPLVNGSQWWRLTAAVNGGQPPWATAEPPLDHHRTTGQRWPGQWSGKVWIG